ncbi:unnamed protein product [Prunus brigantina]
MYIATHKKPSAESHNIIRGDFQQSPLLAPPDSKPANTMGLTVFVSLSHSPSLSRSHPATTIAYVYHYLSLCVSLSPSLSPSHGHTSHHHRLPLASAVCIKLFFIFVFQICKMQHEILGGSFGTSLVELHPSAGFLHKLLVKLSLTGCRSLTLFPTKNWPLEIHQDMD